MSDYIPSTRKEAKEVGAKYYLSAKRCKNDHRPLKYTSCGRCVQCAKDYCAQYRELNPQLYIDSSRAWRERNKSYLRGKDKERYYKNRESILKANRERRRKTPEKNYISYRKWYERNKSKNAHQSRKYDASKRRAIVSWSNDKRIIDIYEKCRKITEETGIKHEVDHIVPLTSDIVCGLHVYDNLEILESSENRSKRNSYWPDMP